MAPLISPDEALRLVLENTGVLAARSVGAALAVGCVLAETVLADRDYPPFDRAMMDGYAVAAGDAGKTAPVIGEAAAGKGFDGVLQAGGAVEIMTGAPCPEGCEAVAPHEDCERSGDEVRLPDPLKMGQNIARRGGERRAGETVLEKGQVVTALGLAVLASVGKTHVSVIPKPRVAILTTGDELAAGAPGAAQIRDSNGPMLAAMARGLGLEEVRVGHVADDAAALAGAVGECGDREIVILTGGVSMGKYDLVPGVLEREGARRVFHKVSQRPGKPLLFAVGEGQLFFGLPGNPLSCHVCFHRYIGAAVRKMMGLPAAVGMMGRLGEALENKSPRTHFQLAQADWDGAGWVLTPLRGKGSADVFTAAAANAVVRVEAGSGVGAGGVVGFEWV